MLRRGGEQGIRTLEASFKAYTISSRAPSTSSDNSPYQTARILYQKGDQNASPFFLKKFQKTLDFIYCLLYNLNVAFIGVWRSLVSRLNGVQEAAGSNPVTRTTSEQAMYRLLRLFLKVRARSRRCSSFPTATRCAGLAVGGPPCGRHFSPLKCRF